MQSLITRQPASQPHILHMADSMRMSESPPSTSDDVSSTIDSIAKTVAAMRAILSATAA